LDQIRRDAAVVASDECRRWVGAAYKLAYGFDEHVSDSQMYELSAHHAWAPRMPPHVLLACGGWSSGAPCGVIESYDERADDWLQVGVRRARARAHLSSSVPRPQVPFDDPTGPRAYHGCVVLDDQLYTAGGFVGQAPFSSVRAMGSRAAYLPGSTGPATWRFQTSGRSSGRTRRT